MITDMHNLLLFDLYGNMLSERQHQVVDSYYNQDHSLAEISENIGITRQGVRDFIMRAERRLQTVEEQLGLARRLEEMDRTARQIMAQSDKIAKLAHKGGNTKDDICQMAQEINGLADSMINWRE